MRLLVLLFFPFACIAQGYTSYFTGNATNITTTPTPGTCLMGGATENDNAMIWLLQKANGGDVVVLRSSGGSGYNNYMYSELGVNVNSVETLVITSAAGATNPYVLQKVANAELIWFAGGDQWNYIQYFKDNALEDLLNYHINEKQAPIGGTSAGMAILGSHYYTAQNGTVSSGQALNNPYHANMTLGVLDFLQVPYLNNVITDTHYDNPDRRGRHVAFMARLIDDLGFPMRGIACNEYVAVCIDGNGMARVYGDYSNYNEFAYFILPNCEYQAYGVETCSPAIPLTWNHNGQALKVYKVPGTMAGTNYFDLGSSSSDPIVSGGTWEHWSVSSGLMATAPGTAQNNCALSNKEQILSQKTAPWPNPFENYITLNTDADRVMIYDALNRLVYSGSHKTGEVIDTAALPAGLYFVSLENNGTANSYKMIKK